MFASVLCFFCSNPSDQNIRAALKKELAVELEN